MSGVIRKQVFDQSLVGRPPISRAKSARAKSSARTSSARAKSSARTSSARAKSSARTSSARAKSSARTSSARAKSAPSKISLRKKSASSYKPAAATASSSKPAAATASSSKPAAATASSSKPAAATASRRLRVSAPSFKPTAASRRLGAAMAASRRLDAAASAVADVSAASNDEYANNFEDENSTNNYNGYIQTVEEEFKSISNTEVLKDIINKLSNRLINIQKQIPKYSRDSHLVELRFDHINKIVQLLQQIQRRDDYNSLSKLSKTKINSVLKKSGKGYDELKKGPRRVSAAITAKAQTKVAHNKLQANHASAAITAKAQKKVAHNKLQADVKAAAEQKKVKKKVNHHYVLHTDQQKFTNNIFEKIRTLGDQLKAKQKTSRQVIGELTSLIKKISAKILKLTPRITNNTLNNEVKDLYTSHITEYEKLANRINEYLILIRNNPNALQNNNNNN
jgi:hypothetical protein